MCFHHSLFNSSIRYNWSAFPYLDVNPCKFTMSVSFFSFIETIYCNIWWHFIGINIPFCHLKFVYFASIRVAHLVMNSTHMCAMTKWKLGKWLIPKDWNLKAATKIAQNALLYFKFIYTTRRSSLYLSPLLKFYVLDLGEVILWFPSV